MRRVHISELDVPTWYLGATAAEKLARQADSYRTVAAACQSQPACFRITTWGFSDRYTWRGVDSTPLPFDSEYRPKPAWIALQAVLRPAPSGASHPAALAVDATASPAVQQPPTLSARVRRRSLASLLRHRSLPVVLSLRDATEAHVAIVARLGGRKLARTERDLHSISEQVVHLRLTPAARRLPRRARGSVLSIQVVGADAKGNRFEACARTRLR